MKKDWAKGHSWPLRKSAPPPPDPAFTPAWSMAEEALKNAKRLGDPAVPDGTPGKMEWRDGTLHITGNVSFSGAIYVHGNVTVGGSLDMRNSRLSEELAPSGTLFVTPGSFLPGAPLDPFTRVVEEETRKLGG